MEWHCYSRRPWQNTIQFRTGRSLQNYEVHSLMYYIPPLTQRGSLLDGPSKADWSSPIVGANCFRISQSPLSIQGGLIHRQCWFIFSETSPTYATPEGLNRLLNFKNAIYRVADYNWEVVTLLTDPYLEMAWAIVFLNESNNGIIYWTISLICRYISK